MGLITALTGHFCIDHVKALSPIPIIDGVEIIDRYCAARQIGVLGLLGSPPVLTNHLFGLLRTPKTVVPQEGLVELGEAYMEVARSGVCSADNRKRFFKAGAEMIHEQQAEAILLAGTDLGLALGGQDPRFPVIDALELHIEALVSLQVGKPKATEHF